MEQINYEEYINNLIIRNNSLNQESLKIDNEINKRNEFIRIFSEQISKDFTDLKKIIEEIRRIHIDAEISRKLFEGEFKNIAKKDQEKKLESRIDKLNYEHLVTRDEFERKYSQFED